jgi:hypothetical protein
VDLLELQPQGTIGIVTRRVERSPDVVDLVLGSDRPLVGAPFAVIVPFRPVPAELRSWGWRAQLRLRWARPALVPDPVVRVELCPWSTTSTELRLAPASAHALRWGDRRWNRYFSLAHEAAQVLVAALTSTPTALPASPPAGRAQNWNVF